MTPRRVVARSAALASSSGRARIRSGSERERNGDYSEFARASAIAASREIDDLRKPRRPVFDARHALDRSEARVRSAPIDGQTTHWMRRFEDRPWSTR